MKTNPYLVLGISPTASGAEVRKRFHALVAECHPDKHGGSRSAEARLKEINAAYDELKDPARRAALDARLRVQALLRVARAPAPAPAPMPTVEDWIKAVDSPTAKAWMRLADVLTKDAAPTWRISAVIASALAGAWLETPRR